MAQIIDAPRNNLDKTVRVFDQFYNFDLVVNASQYEVIYSYFYSVNKNKTIASNFTTLLFRISSITGEDVMTLLNDITGKEKLKANALLTYYLNSVKSKTTLYGLSSVPQPNQSVQRNVVV
jgi:hypothetical protein